MAGSDRRPEFYLIADQMREIATAGRQYATNVYEAKRAERLMGLAAELATLADDATPEAVRAHFLAEPWHRVSPAIGADAAVFDEDGRILLVRPNDGTGWAMPVRPGHGTRVPKVFEMARDGETFFDPASSYGMDLPMHQRPDET